MLGSGDSVPPEGPVLPGGGGDGGKKRTAAEEAHLKHRAEQRRAQRAKTNALGGRREWRELRPPKYHAPARAATKVVPKHSQPTPPQPHVAIGPAISTTLGGGTTHARSMQQLELHARLVDAEGLLARQSGEIQALQSELNHKDIRIQDLESRPMVIAETPSVAEPSRSVSRFMEKKCKHVVIVGCDERDKLPMLLSANLLARHLTEYAAAEGEVAIIQWGAPLRL